MYQSMQQKFITNISLISKIKNKWGIINGITELAQDLCYKFRETRLDMEQWAERNKQNNTDYVSRGKSFFFTAYLAYRTDCQGKAMVIFTDGLKVP